MFKRRHKVNSVAVYYHIHPHFLFHIIWMTLRTWHLSHCCPGRPLTIVRHIGVNLDGETLFFKITLKPSYYHIHTTSTHTSFMTQMIVFLLIKIRDLGLTLGEWTHVWRVKIQLYRLLILVYYNFCSGTTPIKKNPMYLILWSMVPCRRVIHEQKLVNQFIGAIFKTILLLNQHVQRLAASWRYWYLNVQFYLHPLIQFTIMPLT